jgi:hypothetical protein
MNPDTFNRLRNSSETELVQFVSWLTKITLVETRAAQSDIAATRIAWTSYFRRGLKADMLFGELMELFESIFHKVGYSSEESLRVVELVKQIDLRELGIRQTESGLKFDGSQT